jgi:hypothetical protein
MSAATLAAGACLAGCGSAGPGATEGDVEPGIADWGWAETAAAASPMKPLAGDLIPVPILPSLPAGAPQGDPAETDLLEAPGDPVTGDPPKVFYLNYADGRALPRTNPNPCRDTAPKFVCGFAPTAAECQRQIQAYLDRWYADFNVVFTLTRPASGSFYTEVVSSGGGAWCDAAANVAGVAPFLCDDLSGGVAYTFIGGKNAKETAIIISQEHAHLVGLEHTLSTKDIMDPTICPDCDGFENVENRIQNDHCGRTRQNSYQMMKERLGTWTGGIKPTPFGCDHDAVTPLVRILAPVENATVGSNFPLVVQASDDCKISQVSVAVAPMGLQTQSTKAPFEWTLTKIKGRQTITVTAVDPSGKQSTATVTVNAPGAPTAGDAGATDGGGMASSDDGGPEIKERGAGCVCDASAGAATRTTTGWSLLGGLTLMALTLAGRRRAGSASLGPQRQRQRQRPSRFFTGLRERS